MKNLMLLMILASNTVLSNCTATNIPAIELQQSDQTVPTNIDGDYTLVIEGFDWGAAASKVILSNEGGTSQADGSQYEVVVNKSTPCAELSPEESTGNLKVLYAYPSDAEGSRIASGDHITLVLYVAPFEQMNSPIKYFFGNPKCAGNQWLDFDLSITNTETKQTWTKETNRIIPLIDEFDLTGKHTHDDITLTYASYTPKNKNGKQPLLIWLHGGGEGGSDTSIPLLANRAANYAAPEIQAFFDGAYVLVPQTPTFWMNNGEGQYTRGEVDDMYNKSLIALIKNYVNQNPNIDPDRIYLGGCSNGGYMTLKLMLLHPDYFAAGFPSALAYHGGNLTNADAQRIKDLPIWFIHSADDPVTKPEETVLPTYKKLKAAGAKNIYLSYFDHVVDITNQFGGKDFHYNGHFSWVYSHTNKCQLDYDGTPVLVDGKPVTLMGWLAQQRRASTN